MIKTLFSSLGIALITTVLLETGFFLAVGKRDRKDMLLVVAVNILTNPAVVLLYWLAVLYTGFNHILVIGLLEVTAFAAEGRYYQKYGRTFIRPYLFSAAANAVSFGIGLLIQYILFRH